MVMEKGLKYPIRSGDVLRLKEEDPDPAGLLTFTFQVDDHRQDDHQQQNDHQSWDGKMPPVVVVRRRPTSQGSHGGQGTSQIREQESGLIDEPLLQRSPSPTYSSDREQSPASVDSMPPRPQHDAWLEHFRYRDAAVNPAHEKNLEDLSEESEYLGEDGTVVDWNDQDNIDLSEAKAFLANHGFSIVNKEKKKRRSNNTNAASSKKKKKTAATKTTTATSRKAATTGETKQTKPGTRSAQTSSTRPKKKGPSEPRAGSSSKRRQSVESDASE